MTVLQIKRTLKGLFFLLRLHWLIPATVAVFLANLAALSRWIRQHSELAYSDFYTLRRRYRKRYDLFEYVIDKEGLEGRIDYLEFGVSKGVSFRWWAERIKHPDARFFGFDTFTGLPEDWGQFKKGSMSGGNEPPEIDDGRCRFIQGLFQQTLPGFLNEYDSDRRKVIHMDADLYSATLYVLTLVTPSLKKGDVLFFDEFSVPHHEFKAFSEWVSAFYVDYQVIGAVNNYHQIALKIV